MSESIQTAKSTVKRVPSRGIYNREQVYEILDQHFLCHISYTIDGKPFIVPTSYGRKGDWIYLHGSVKSQMMMNLQKSPDVAFCVTFMDGLVLARSVFHHSINYRSVILYGKAEYVTDPEEKMEGLRTLTEQIIAGRWEEARHPNAQEMKATAVFKFKIEEGAAKVRAAGVSDDKEDYQLPVWAGIVPIQQQILAPIPDPAMEQDLELPTSVVNYMSSQNPM